jgi:hypothetical protein
MVRLARPLSQSSLSAVLGLFLSSAAFAAPVFNPVTDLTTGANPQGVWSMGTETTIGGTLTPFTQSTAACFTGIQSWWSAGTCATGPFVWQNNTGAPFTLAGVLTQQTTELNLGAGATQYSVLRFTAPSNGVYAISGFFRAIDSTPTSSDVHIAINGVDVFDAGDFTYLLAQPFSFSPSLLTGATVDFIVGNGGNGPANDSNGLTLSINTAPEPGGAMLIMLGTGLLVAFRKRRARA